jgi:formylglycine-generating enzyme required for sulfatase activity
MGAPPERDNGGNSDDGPERRVRITRGFYIDQLEVTNRQFAMFLVATGNQCPDDPRAGLCADPTSGGSPFDSETDFVIEPGKENLPIEIATKAGALAYCEWAGKALPSEAQWQLAASRDPMSGHESLYPWGDEWVDGVANCAESDCRDGHRHVTPVGSFPKDRTAIGALDMGGNATEWVRDCYQERFPSCADVCVDPMVITECEDICVHVNDDPCARREPGAIQRGGSAFRRKSRMWAFSRHVISLKALGGAGLRCIVAGPEP